MVRDVAFGQYFPAKSLIHKLDPRAKIIMLIWCLCFVHLTMPLLPLWQYAQPL